jgi:hypothetical protein
MPRGTKISPSKLAQSSASAKKIKELEKKADAAKKNAILNGGSKKKVVAVPPPKATPQSKPVVEEKREDDNVVVFDHKKASKAHYSHDEKRHMKYLRNKIRDGVELSEEEVLFATNHKIELSKAKKKVASGEHKDAHHDKTHDKKKAEATKGHGKSSAASAKAKKH